MLPLLTQGLIEWIYGLILEIWEFAAEIFLDILSMDFDYIETQVPIITEISSVLVAVGWALLLGNLVFQAIKAMTAGLGFEAEDPPLLFTRTFVFAFLLMASPQICEIGLGITQSIIDVLKVPDAVDIQFPGADIFGSMTAAWLLVIICDLFIMFHMFKFMVEIFERYVILAVLTMCAPLAFAMGGSRSTFDLFTGWCRMFGSMCFVMVSNIIFLKMVFSISSAVPSGPNVFLWMILVFTLIKTAKKIDVTITRIGLNPAITGDDLGRALPGALSYVIMKAATSQISKVAGTTFGASTSSSGGSGFSNYTSNFMKGQKAAGRSRSSSGANSQTNRQSNRQSTTQTAGNTTANQTTNTANATQSTNGQPSVVPSPQQNTAKAPVTNGTQPNRQTQVQKGQQAPRMSATPQSSGRQSVQNQTTSHGNQSRVGGPTTSNKVGSTQQATATATSQFRQSSGKAGTRPPMVANASATKSVGNAKAGNGKAGTTQINQGNVQSAHQQPVQVGGQTVQQQTNVAEQNNTSSGVSVANPQSTRFTQRPDSQRQSRNTANATSNTNVQGGNANTTQSQNNSVVANGQAGNSTITRPPRTVQPNGVAGNPATQSTARPSSNGVAGNPVVQNPTSLTTNGVAGNPSVQTATRPTANGMAGNPTPTRPPKTAQPNGMAGKAVAQSTTRPPTNGGAGMASPSRAPRPDATTNGRAGTTPSRMTTPATKPSTIPRELGKVSPATASTKNRPTSNSRVKKGGRNGR